MLRGFLHISDRCRYALSSAYILFYEHLKFKIMKTTSSYILQSSSPVQVVIQRKTAESDILVTIEGGWEEQKTTPRPCTWNTGIKFLNHMLQTICRRASLNIDARFECVLQETFAEHVVWEDVGLVFGAGIAELMEQRRESGVEGAGFGVACIDEALSQCFVSFEGRSGCYIAIAESQAKRKEFVEDAKTQDVRQFFDGFAQGGKCSVHLQIGSAEDSHHLWESAFRAFGEALRVSMRPNTWRKGVIVGVKDARD